MKTNSLKANLTDPDSEPRPTLAAAVSETHSVGFGVPSGQGMTAIVYHRYGSPDVLRLEERAQPEVGEDDVLVKVRAAAVNPYDWHFVRGKPYFMRIFIGLRKPRANNLGVDFSGTVEAVGKNVAQYQPGDEVFGAGKGAFAERLSISACELARKPSNLTFEEAAAVPLAALTALQCLRDGGCLQAGQSVLIIGASGGVGTFAVQIGKILGAHVTGVCSTRNLGLVRSLGADRVIDYTTEDLLESDGRYDLILHLAGMHSPSDLRRILTPKGTLIQSSGDSNNQWFGPMGRWIKAAVLSPFVSQKLSSWSMKRSKRDLLYLAELIESGKVTPVIDRTYSFTQVPEALCYLEQGHARGKVVISMSPASTARGD